MKPPHDDSDSSRDVKGDQSSIIATFNTYETTMTLDSASSPSSYDWELKLKTEKGSRMKSSMRGDEEATTVRPHSRRRQPPVPQPELVVATRVSSSGPNPEEVISAEVTLSTHQHQDSEAIVVHADPVSPGSNCFVNFLKSAKGRTIILLLILMAVALVGVSTVVVKASNGKDNVLNGPVNNNQGSQSLENATMGPTSAVTITSAPPFTSTTTAPTAAPTTMAPTSDLEGYLVDRNLLPSYTLPALRNASSPQSRALRWLETTHSKEVIANLTAQDRLLQRFALATFYYATNGFGWQFNRYWLSTTHECFWWSHLELPGAAGSGGSQSVCNDRDQYVGLLLDNNILRGTLPPEVALLTALEDISLVADSFGVSQEDKKKRFLTGGIPAEYGLYLSNLKHLDVSKNALASTIPSEIGLLSNSLDSLRLLENNMAGSLPKELSKLTKLQTLFIYDNSFTGTIPTELGLLADSLLDINAIKNEMTGTIPTELGALTKLTHLSLQENHLVSTIPSELGRLESLTWLLLKQNKLTGTLPSQLGNLSRLRLLYLEYNNFTGPLPTWLGTLQQARDISIENNKFSGTIPSELGLLTKLILIDMTQNLLTGTMPAELCAIPTSALRYTINVDCLEVQCHCSCCTSCRCER